MNGRCLSQTAPVVAIVGGGASGTLTAIQLLRTAASPLCVVLIDRYGRHGRGVAYATADSQHLLNVPAERMSALPHDPGHLVRWAGRDGFLPRAEYGTYLAQTLSDEERAAAPNGTVHRITGAVVAVTDGAGRPIRLQLSHGGRVDADAVVLASGVLPRRERPLPVDGFHRYLDDPWRPGRLASIRDGAPVLAIGTGLTLVDVALTVTRAHPETTVHAVSRHGLLPNRHRPTTQAPTPPATVDIPAGPLDVPGLLRVVRRAAGGRRAAAHHPGDWRDVVDTLRAQVPSLWSQLPRDEQERFLHRIARYWEIHRHRMAPTVAERIDEPNSRTCGAERVSAGWLVNCTGPAGDPLLDGLLRAGLVTTDHHHLGLATDGDGALLDARGRPHDRLFTLGPLRRGELYETTAIPEIRAQAAAIAARILGAVTATQRIRSA